MNYIADFIGVLRWQDFLDVGILALIIYRIILMLQGTRTVQILAGFLILAFSFYISDLLALDGVSWVLSNFFNSIVVVMIVLFQADFRNALATMGTKTLLRDTKSQDSKNILERIYTVCEHLSEARIGALIVLESEVGLRDYYASATKLNAEFSPQLLVALFSPKAPLHDGAVVINRQHQIAYAGCILPLSSNIDYASNLGTRHRAALGLSEETDAVILVVSEETGTIRLAYRGELEHIAVKDKFFKLLVKSYK